MYILRDQSYSESKVELILHVIDRETYDEDEIIAITGLIEFKYGNGGVYKQEISLTEEDFDILKNQLDNLDLSSPLNVLTLDEPDLSFFVLGEIEKEHPLDLLISLDSGQAVSNIGTESGVALRMTVTVDEFNEWILNIKKSFK
ncbi:hypothetical protein [Bacillus sp. JCM 19041]|uniref:hypothetical protein n=1 Tax=Bacillus sp. JCM 19041 TaxID=1460637 RepID=UPI0006CF85D6